MLLYFTYLVNISQGVVQYTSPTFDLYSEFVNSAMIAPGRTFTESKDIYKYDMPKHREIVIECEITIPTLEYLLSLWRIVWILRHGRIGS